MRTDAALLVGTSAGRLTQLIERRSRPLDHHKGAWLSYLGVDGLRTPEREFQPNQKLPGRVMHMCEAELKARVLPAGGN
jgi:hypothetical protein